MKNTRSELCKTCISCNQEYLNQAGEGCPMWHNDKKYGGCTEYYPQSDKNNCIICNAIRSGVNMKFENDDLNDIDLYFCPRCGKKIRVDS